MKIGFLLGSPAISGGTYVIIEHATRLQQLGHEITIITKKSVDEEEYAWHSSAHQLCWLNHEHAGEQKFDVILATWWQSPFMLQDFAADHYIYFVQSIETRFFETPDPTDYGAQDHAVWQQLCEKTYSFALPMITEAKWIQQYLYEQYNNYPSLVRNGIRKDIYTVNGPSVSPVTRGKLRVLLEGPVDVPYKNVPVSVTLARQAGADEVWLLTSSAISEYSGVDRVFSRVPIHETPAIYRSCDVLLKLSYVEGMFGPPLEMFHCGGTAIVYKVTGYDEYIVHDQNSFVADRDDEQGVVRYLQQLKEEPETLARLKEGAGKTAQQWPDWEHCSREFERALMGITDQRRTSRQYLRRYTKEILQSAIPLTKEKVLKRFSARERQIARGKTEDRNNFVEFYWHSGEEFKSENLQWHHYFSGEKTLVSFDVDVSGFPFWLRLDPSTRVGVVEISSIVVTNTVTGKEIMAFREPDDFGVLLLSGTAYWIDLEYKNIIFSFGADPALVLPAVQPEQASLGDRLSIAIELHETGIQQFFREYAMKLRQEQAVLQEDACAPSSSSWYHTLVTKMLGSRDR